MPMKPLHIPALLLIAALAGCLQSSDLGEPAPEFAVTDSAGQTVSLTDFEGKPVVLLFAFVNGCPSCVAETRDVLVPLHEEFNGSIGFVTFTILPKHESDEDLERFKKRYNASWNHARDTQGITQDYSVTQLSTVVVLDAEHRIRLVKVDPSKTDIREAIQ